MIVTNEKVKVLISVIKNIKGNYGIETKNSCGGG